MTFKKFMGLHGQTYMLITLGWIHAWDTKEECGTLASRQRWHFALAVTTGKPVLASVTASKPGARCLFLFTERRATFQGKKKYIAPPLPFYIGASHS